jgi:1,4-dihydroxy-2-naphthoate octaprenyltransferase
MRLKSWIDEIRVPYLFLPVILAAIGGVLALENGHFNALNFVIFTAILVLLHISVNTLNDYYDNKTGIDLHTKRTMFNGGSGIIQSGALTPKDVLNAALACFVLALVLSAYLVLTVSTLLLLIVIPGMLFTLFYTQFFARNMLGEIAAGLGLGCLPVIGAYLVQIQDLPLSLLMISIPASLLTFNLLLLNEFPDVKADVTGGRRNIVISLGEKGSAWLYMATTAGVYLSLIIGLLLSIFPIPAALALLTLPVAFKAVQGAFDGTKQVPHFMSAQKANVQVVLVTQILFVVGCIAAIAL